MNAKHTPGPWKAVSQTVTEELEVFEIAEVSYMRVVPQGGGWPSHGRPEADARLIAAAPELLAALASLETSGALETLLDMDKAAREDGESDIFTPAVAAARAAIVKATGSEVDQ